MYAPMKSRDRCTKSEEGSEFKCQREGESVRSKDAVCRFIKCALKLSMTLGLKNATPASGAARRGGARAPNLMGCVAFEGANRVDRQTKRTAIDHED